MAGSGTTTERPRVVVLGGGFAGLYAARALKRAPVHVTLIDRRNFHLFQPLLYQVATAALSPGDIAGAIRAILHHQKNLTVWMGEVVGVDVEHRRVRLADADVPYDYLIVATGSTHSYFGHPEWERSTCGLKTVDDALEIRRRFLLAFEAAERESDPAAQHRQLTFVIVGGGPTGVELAGAMAEIARKALPREFDAIDPAAARVILLEGGPRILATYPPALSEKARRQLQKLGVEVRTGALVTDIERAGVRIGEEQLAAANVFWAAGVAASPIGRALGVPLDRSGRVLVGPDCSVPGHPEVLVVGDLAHVEQNDQLVPGVAQAAMQMGRHAASAIRDDLAGRARGPLHYRDKGSLAVIGRGAAVADIAGFQLSGLVAWLVWLFVHITYLIGFRNRLLVLVQWSWSYVFWQRGIRLITGDPPLELERALAAGEGASARTTPERPAGPPSRPPRFGRKRPRTAD